MLRLNFTDLQVASAVERSKLCPRPSPKATIPANQNFDLNQLSGNIRRVDRRVAIVCFSGGKQTCPPGQGLVALARSGYCPRATNLRIRISKVKTLT
jgi:hypothetical protein